MEASIISLPGVGDDTSLKPTLRLETLWLCYSRGWLPFLIAGCFFAIMLYLDSGYSEGVEGQGGLV